MSEYIREVDKNGNEIYYQDFCDDRKYWWEYDENNRVIYSRTDNDVEFWHKYDDSGNRISISRKEFEEIKKLKYKRKIEKRSYRFEIMDI